MTVDASALLADLKRQVRSLEDDLRSSATSTPELDARLRSEHGAATAVGRTATAYTAWLDSQVTQASVAWVLGTVFVRFCEDNGLVSDPWLAGPGQRTSLAVDRQRSYFLAHPLQNDADWLLAGFEHLRSFPAVAALFDEGHNPLYRLRINGDAAESLIAFWRQSVGAGAPVHDLTDPALSTRFLGDLYQDMSEAARKQFALLQTPDFVEELILDLTLDPAIQRFGLEGLRIIDPTCGSGHFLLGAFHRLVEQWALARPGMDQRERVQAALDSVHGVDVNPFATAISKFRLTVEAMRASNVTTLAQAPGYRLHVATGDSLLWEQGGLAEELPYETEDGKGLAAHQYLSEDLDEHPDILQPGRYHAVVGNPPYITVKDKALNLAYRLAYPSCSGKYALSVPFMELFFRLAASDTNQSGFVGQITSNSFMKREFGKKIVEQFLASRDLNFVIDSSGAYIPGHGTPTVILAGRNRYPEKRTVRAVLGVRGEPSVPVRPAEGVVWRSIVDHLGESGFENEFVSVADVERSSLTSHPWAMSGGGSADVMEILSGQETLASCVSRIGFFGIMGADDAMTISEQVVRREALEDDVVVPLGVGDRVRDYRIVDSPPAIFPYTEDHLLVDLSAHPNVYRWLWPLRAELGGRATFKGGTYTSDGRSWWEWHQLPADNGSLPLAITFAAVATHNHFVLERGRKAFKQSAPVIKFAKGTSEDWLLGLLALLNSSTACFWLKQVSHNKGSTVDPKGARQTTVEWENFYDFTGTKLKSFPLPVDLAPDFGRTLDRLQTERARETPTAIAAGGAPSRARLDAGRVRYESLTRQMIFWQEELDWATYHLYGLIDEDLTYHGDPIELDLGERAFEIFIGRMVTSGITPPTTWFERHRSTMLTGPDMNWPEEYQDVYFRRHNALQEAPLKLIERPECKRRWASDTWEQMETAALRDWLLDRLESRNLWFAQGRPRIRSIAQVADALAANHEFVDVLRLWSGQRDVEVTVALSKLLADEHVPFLAAHRYKESGLRARAAWEETWDLQRQEDTTGQQLDIAVPPKYKPADFVRSSYWKHRGKLDVPKERFISYPGAERGADSTIVLGWAGWDHAEQALALATYALDRQTADAWDADRLVPLWAGVAELEPWVRQWHSHVDPQMGQSPAAAVTATLEQSLARLGSTRGDLSRWRPQPAGRGRGPRKENA